MFNTTFSKIRTSFKNIWQRLRLALGLTLAWLFALILLGNLAQEGVTASAIAAAQSTEPAAESSLSEKKVITESDSLPNRASSRAPEVCSDTIKLTDVSVGVSNQPSSNYTGDNLTFWSTGNLAPRNDANNSDGNLEIFWGKVIRISEEPGQALDSRQVTTSTGSILGGFNLAPSLNYSGTRLAFFSDRNLTGKNEDENFEIFWSQAPYNLDDVLQVTETDLDYSNILPSISQDGNKIAFVSDADLAKDENGDLLEFNKDGSQEIFVATIDNNENIIFTQVTSSTTQIINDEPVITPDGNAVVFTHNDNNDENNIELYFAKVMSSSVQPEEPKKLTNTPAEVINEQPTISEFIDDDYYDIAFVSNNGTSNKPNIWLVRVDGNGDPVAIENNNNQNEINLTNSSTASSEQPSISLDGTRIAFTSDGNFTAENPNQKSQIFVYDLKAKEFSQITNNELTEQSNNQPSISGDGTQVAFISQGNLYQNRCPLSDLSVDVKTSVAPPPNFQLTDTIIAGTPLVYQITAINEGPSDATGVKITTTVPANTELADNPNWTCDGSTPAICEYSIDNFNYDDLNDDANEKNYYFTVKVQSDVISGTELTNTVGILGNQLDRDPISNTKQITTTVIRDTKLSISVSAVDEVEPGNEIVYTLEVSNTGASDVLSATVRSSWNTTDADFVSADQGGTPLPPTTTIWGPELQIAAGESKTFTLALDLNDPVAAELENLINSVSVWDDLDNGDDDEAVTTVVAEPELELTKSDGGMIPQPGDDIIYTLTYTNNGNQDATGVVLTETVPVNTTFNEGASNPDWVCDENSTAAGTDCTLPIGYLTGGGTDGEILFAVTITNPVPAGVEVITNTAGITATHNPQDDPDSVRANDEIQTILNASPELTITKSANVTVISPTKSIIYTLTYTNTGNQGARGVRITETVPANTTFEEQGGWECNPSSNIVEAGASCVFLITNEVIGGNDINPTVPFTVTVNESVTAGAETITNTVKIGNDPDESDSRIEEMNELTTTLNAAPDLKIVKDDIDDDGDDDVKPGDLITYTLTYSNESGQDTTVVTITEEVPTYTTYYSETSSDWTCNGHQEHSICTYEVETLGVNEEGTITFTVQVTNPVPFEAEEIINTATITDNAINGEDSDLLNNITEQHTKTLTAAPTLTLTIDDGGITAHPSDTIVYSLNYTNAGNQEAINVVLSETIPANTTFNEAASHPDWQGCADNSLPGTNCTFDVGVLKGLGGIGYTGTITFAVTVSNPVPSGVIEINNRAKIADNNDSNPLSSATDESTTHVEASPELQIDKDDNDDAVEPGNTITYTLTYTNAGNQDTVNITITEEVPDNTRFNLAASSSGWNDCPNNSAAGTICTYSIPSLRGGKKEIGVITFGLTVIDPVPNGEIEIVNTATITDNAINEADLVPSNNTATDTNQLDAAPDLQLTIDDGGITTAPSQNLVYTLTYTNAGNQGATGIEITETVPEETVFNSAQSHPDWDCQGNTCTYDVGSLQGGSTIDSTGMVSFTVTVVESIEAGRTQIINTATIDDDGTNGNDAAPADNTDTETTPVTAEPILELAISDGVTNVFANNEIVYTLRITNSGNQAATGIVLTDRLPINTTFQSATSNGQHNNSVVTWTIPSLLGGNTVQTRSVTARVIPDLAAGRHELENLAGVTDNGQNSNIPNQPKTASATDTNTARSAFMSITPANQIVNEGDTFNVTVEVAGGNLDINQVFAYLNFDETYLEVISLTPLLPTTTQEFYNNTGVINFVTTDDQIAPFSTGTFNVVEVEFRAIAETPNNNDTMLTFNVNPSGARNTSVRADGLTDRFLTDETGATIQIQDFGLTLAPDSLAVCIGQNSSTTVNLTAINGFDDPVTLTSQGQPANTTVNFSANPVTPPGSSTVTVNATAGAVLGTYDFDIIGSVGGLEHSDTLSLEIQDVPGSVTLNPLNDNSTRPTFSWQAASAADDYDIQIATDASFNNIVHSANRLSPTTSYRPPTAALDGGTTYFWRVQANNGCGSVESTSSSFTTHEFDLNVTPASRNICRNNNTETNYTIEVQPSLGFDDDVTLTVDEPNNSSAAFDTNPVTSADYTSILTISDIDQVQVGSYTINIDGTADNDGLERSTSVTLNVQDVPGAVALTSPTYDQTDVPTDTITFEWTAPIGGATSYDIRISRLENFPSVQTDEFNIASNTYTYTPATPLDTDTRYYWQVRANNDCGNGPYSTRFRFRTANTNAIVNIQPDDSTPIRQLTRDGNPEEVLPMRVLQKGPIHKERLILLSRQISGY